MFPKNPKSLPEAPPFNKNAALEPLTTVGLYLNNQSNKVGNGAAGRPPVHLKSIFRLVNRKPAGMLNVSGVTLPATKELATKSPAAKAPPATIEVDIGIEYIRISSYRS